MGKKDTETCGRCSMTTVVGASRTDEDAEAAGRDPFAGERIEVPESEARLAGLPAVWLGRAKRRLDAVATRLTYGR